MRVHMLIYMYIYLIHTYMYVQYMYVCVCVYIYICFYMHTETEERVSSICNLFLDQASGKIVLSHHIHVHARHTFIRTYVYAHLYSRHTYIQIHAYTNTRSRRRCGRKGSSSTCCSASGRRISSPTRAARRLNWSSISWHKRHTHTYIDHTCTRA